MLSRSVLLTVIAAAAIPPAALAFVPPTADERVHASIVDRPLISAIWGTGLLIAGGLTLALVSERHRAMGFAAAAGGLLGAAIIRVGDTALDAQNRSLYPRSYGVRT